MSRLRCLLMSFLVIFSVSDMMAGDTLHHERRPFFKKVTDKLYRFVKDFNDIDTNYIEPQHYNFTVMLQNTNTFDFYQMGTKDGQKLKFASDPTIKIGPYIGWRWIFLGYTFDVNKIDMSGGKKEFDVSLYSSQLGIDLFYRKSGDKCKIDNIDLGRNINTDKLHDISFSGLEVGVKGFNIYYIFNHRKFSYPAAFSQSTCQKRSCGSPLVGFSYTRHSLSLDFDKLKNVIATYVPESDFNLDERFKFNRIKYTDIAFSGGYAYNWVFAKNFLFCASISAALGYKRSTGDIVGNSLKFRNFSLSNLNFDGIGRFGLVWNNTHWYCGASAVMHAYNYKKSHFSSRNTYGTFNLYVGFNFDRR